MANKSTHLFIGAATGIGVYALCKSVKNENLTLEGAIGSLLLGAFAGCLPDALEPALNPHHRDLFHSVTAFGLLAFGAEKTFKSNGLNQNTQLILSIGLCSYLSHLLIDATTSKSLPLLGKLG